MVIPYLGDLASTSSPTRQQAEALGGTISGKTLTWDQNQSAYVLADLTVTGGVYTGSPPGSNTPLIILPDPNTGLITINGPVVATGDVIIRGKVSGRGTIYSARNVHIIGDIEYNNPPNFDQNTTEADPRVLVSAEASKDFLGLIANGSFVLGDYTTIRPNNPWQCRMVLTAGGCAGGRKLDMTGEGQFQGLDPNAPALGYDNAPTSNCAGAPCFNRNYTYDPGLDTNRPAEDRDRHKRYNARTQAWELGRKLYESSIDDQTFRQAVEVGTAVPPTADGRPARIHAVMYTNHIVAGRANDPEVLGGLVARETLIKIAGANPMLYNYDMRVWYTGTIFNVHLPVTEQPPTVVSYKIKK